MGEEPNFGKPSQSSNPSIDPLNMAYLLGQIRRIETQTPRGHYPTPKIRPQRKPHLFSESQKLSYEFVKNCVPSMSEAFSSSELKKAFRQAAMILHPDHGGDTQQFMELKFHYENLRCLVSR